MAPTVSNRVAVIGAGVSGLRCASVLLERGFEVTVFEARARVGGRIAQSSEMGELAVDIGANWVHSTGFNPIVELAKETGTPLHLWNESTLMLDPKGNPVSPDLANMTLKRVWEILEQSIEDSKAQTDTLSPTYSLLDSFTAITGQQLASGEITEYEQELVLGMAEMWGAYVGDRVERQSMKFFFLEDCIAGDDCFIPTNYSAIISKIAAAPIRAGSVRLGTPVHSVVSTGGGVEVTHSGGQEHFGAVVVTSPLGWLKRHKDIIQPLSPRVSQAIDSISYGRLEKVLIEFPHAFWEDSVHSVKEGGGTRISFVHWLSPSYATETNPQRWRLECVSFNAFPEQWQRPILLFYTFGDCSSHIGKSIAELDKQSRDQWLRHFFEPYFSRLPNYDETTCSPHRFLATTWNQDEWAGYGSYSNFQVGMEAAADDVLSIRHGMPEQGIFFAGEHTAPFDGLGTVAGAFNSGEAVAHRIAEAARVNNF